MLCEIILRNKVVITDQHPWCEITEQKVGSHRSFLSTRYGLPIVQITRWTTLQSFTSDSLQYSSNFYPGTQIDLYPSIARNSNAFCWTLYLETDWSGYSWLPLPDPLAFRYLRFLLQVFQQVRYFRKYGFIFTTNLFSPPGTPNTISSEERSSLSTTDLNLQNGFSVGLMKKISVLFDCFLNCVQIMGLLNNQLFLQIDYLFLVSDFCL